VRGSGRLKLIVSWDLLMDWFDLHLRESQRVMVAGPVVPVDTVSVRVVLTSQVEAVQVGAMTAVVPPGTFVQLGARASTDIVVLVSGAELLSQMCCHRVAFKQQRTAKLHVKPWLQLRFDYDTTIPRCMHSTATEVIWNYDLRSIRLRYDYDTYTTKNKFASL